jgi:hypothetical protein
VPKDSGGQRRRPGFVTLHRETLAALEQQHGPSLAWTLIRLVAEADHRTATIESSIRETSRRLQVGRFETFRRHVRALAAAGELDLVESPRQSKGAVEAEVRAIRVIRYTELVGALDPESRRDSTQNRAELDSQFDPKTAPLDSQFDSLMGRALSYDQHERALRSQDEDEQEGAPAPDGATGGAPVGTAVGGGVRDDSTRTARTGTHIPAGKRSATVLGANGLAGVALHSRADLRKGPEAQRSRGAAVRAIRGAR